MHEWNMDEALAFRYEEGREEGRERGLEQGLAQGREQTARKALAEGATLEFVSKITGLDAETVARLRPGV